MDVVTMRTQAVAMLVLCAGIAFALSCGGLSLLNVTLETITAAVKEVPRE